MADDPDVEIEDGRGWQRFVDDPDLPVPDWNPVLLYHAPTCPLLTGDQQPASHADAVRINGTACTTCNP